MDYIKEKLRELQKELQTYEYQDTGYAYALIEQIFDFVEDLEKEEIYDD